MKPIRQRKQILVDTDTLEEFQTILAHTRRSFSAEVRLAMELHIKRMSVLDSPSLDVPNPTQPLPNAA
jgi:hypothetical protein